MPTIILVTGNAGQGKTTIAANLALALTKYHPNVLLIDADLNTPKIGYHYGMPLVDRTIQTILNGQDPTYCTYQHPTGLKLIFSSLTETTKQHPTKIIPKLQQYDYIIIDTPNDKKWNTIQTHTILVTTPDFPSIMTTRKNMTQNTIGIIINRAHNDKNELTTTNIQELLEIQSLGTIPDDPNIRKTIKIGHPMQESHPEHKISQTIQDIAAKLINQTTQTHHNGIHTRRSNTHESHT